MVKKSFKRRDLFVSSVDKAVFLVGFFGAIIYLPQLLKIWVGKNVSGISLVSWIGIFLGSIIWVLYGIAHKQKPIIYINIILALMQILIVIGIFIYS